MKDKAIFPIEMIDFSVQDLHFCIIPACYINLNQRLIQKFYELCKDKEILHMIATENPSSRFTLKNAKKFLEDSINLYNKKNLSFFLMNQEIIGLFMVKDLSSIPEIGYFLKKTYRNKGIGKKFISLMVYLLSHYFKGFEAIVVENNLPSLKILRSLNFRIIESKEGKYKLKKLF